MSEPWEDAAGNYFVGDDSGTVVDTPPQAPWPNDTGNSYMGQYAGDQQSGSGNLETDYIVNDKGQIVSSTGEKGKFVDGQWVPGDFARDWTPSSGGFDFSKLLTGLKNQLGKAGQSAIDNPLNALFAAALLSKMFTGGTKPINPGGYAGPGINMGLKATRSPISPINYKSYSGQPVYGPGSSQVTYAAGGGLMGLAGGGMSKRPRYLRGNTDGMADKIDTSIDDREPAKLSHGEFVIPADVVSHLGNGNSDAGADVLYKMMDKVRMARTGRKSQGKQINPNKFMPGGAVEDAKYVDGGDVKGYATGSLVDNPKNTSGTTPGTTTAQNLSSWAGPYVTDYLSKGQALANTPYQSFTEWSGGNVPLTAGTSPLQQQAYTGLSSLAANAPSQFGTATQFATEAGNTAQNLSYTPQNISAPQLQQYQMTQPQDVTGQTATAATLGAAPTFNAAQFKAPTPIQAVSAGIASLGAAPTMEAARLGEAPEMTAARLAASPEAQAALNDFRAQLQNYQMGPAEKVGTQSILEGPGVSAYMSPYIQSVIDIQNREARRQAEITRQADQARLAQAGAYGGSRQAIIDAERNRNLATQMGDIQERGLQSAFQQAQQQFNAEQQARMQAALANQQAGITVGQQNLAANLATQQLGTQTGLQAALANQQAKQQTSLANQALAGQYGLQQGQFEQAARAANQALKGQYGLTQGQMEQAARAANQQMAGQYGITGAQLAQQANNLNAQLANQAALANQQAEYNAALQNAQLAQQAGLANQAMAGQYGLTQGGYNQAAAMQNAQLAQQAALANQQAGLTTGQQNLAANLGIQNLAAGQNLQAQLANQQAGQFGANLGLQANQQQLAAAQALAGIGQGEFGTQLSGLQSLLGAGTQQQQTEQAGIQALMNEYNKQMMYPYQQLQFQQGLLSGLPVATATNTPNTSSYQNLAKQISDLQAIFGIKP